MSKLDVRRAQILADWERQMRREGGFPCFAFGVRANGSAFIVTRSTLSTAQLREALEAALAAIPADGSTV